MPAVSGTQLRLRIGGVVLAVNAQQPLGLDARWQRFVVSDDARADYTYEISRSAHITLPQGELRELGNGQQLLRTQDGVYHVYRSVADGGLIALTHEQDDHCTIKAACAREPWGTMLHHYFEQLALQHALLRQGVLLLHGAFVRVADAALVFTAPSGTGKTTQAKLWERLRGATILNGDRVALALRGNSVVACGVPVSGSAPECVNETLPLRALVSLRRAQYNEVTRVTGAQAVRLLANGAYLPPAFEDDLPQTLNAAITLAGQCRVLTLDCLPDDGAVEALAQALTDA